MIVVIIIIIIHFAALTSEPKASCAIPMMITCLQAAEWQLKSLYTGGGSSTSFHSFSPLNFIDLLNLISFLVALFASSLLLVQCNRLLRL